MANRDPGWIFAADRGGTFTDIVGVSPGGTLLTRKLLSVSAAYEDALIAGIREMLGLNPDEPFPASQVKLIRIGTTVATNALLERRGEPTGLLITKGFRDLLEIGNQSRPRLFDLDIVKPTQLYTSVIEIDERLAANAEPLQPLSDTQVMEALETLKSQGLKSVAVVLMHSWLNSTHELRIGRLAKKLGFAQISLSHQCMPVIKMVGRGQTTMVDAYLSPILNTYVKHIQALTRGCRLEFMQSAGGLIKADQFKGKDAVLSGPAGGVVAVAELARRRDDPKLIGFDMGGTSTDVCRYAGEFERVYEVETAGIPYQANMLKIETVAAGGGSILKFDGQRMRVGPDSAGADPGPACYGRAGPLTITDANLLLGRLIATEFPKQFGPDLNGGLDLEAAQLGFQQLTAEINQATGQSLSAEQIALGFIRIANEQMAKPIKTLSISRGYDVREHQLCCFGGAAALHACSLARILGIKRILVHPLAGVYSAWGILQADNLLQAQISLLRSFQEHTFDQLEEDYRQLSRPLKQQMRNTGYVGTLAITRSLSLRPRGSDGFIQVSGNSYAEALEQFRSSHQRRFGYLPDLNKLEILALQIEVRSPGPALPDYQPQQPARQSGGGIDRPVYLDNGWQTVPCQHREHLKPGASILGPSLIIAEHYTVLIEKDFVATIDDHHLLVIEAIGRDPHAIQPKISNQNAQEQDTEADPVLLEVFNQLFMSIADQMGAALINTAHSVNMKERLDFSCALFNGAGELVANAPHIPVHLGAMGESVKALLHDQRQNLKPGQAWITNHPGKGGSHLPDITLITPVFTDHHKGHNAAAEFFVASRGHHADIGGATAGSMSPFCTRLDQEGVIFDNFLVLENGRFRHRELLNHLGQGNYPARNPGERVSDIQAQIAANLMGESLLQTLIEQQGLQLVKNYMGLIQENAAHSIRLVLGKFLNGQSQFESAFQDQLDDGSPINVQLQITAGDQPPSSHRIRFDFTGSARQSATSFNAPIAVVKAAVIYALRTLLNEDIPLNQGCMSPVDIILPEQSLLNPTPDAAVVAGNVETSQRIVDVILGALGAAAASQGTMNNVILGWGVGPDSRQHYETIGGGAGATARAAGASAVQVHMTNTRITDPEVLEQRYPGLRLEEFSIRQNSGGQGKHRGGDGLVRQFRFLRPTSLSLLTQRRNRSPFGLAGGTAGKPGNNWLIRDSKWIKLDHSGNYHLLAEDILRIETPGGGGFGSAGQ